MEPQILWHYNYWDGPIDGLALHQNQFVWFKLVREDIEYITNEQFEQLSENDQQYYISNDDKFYRIEKFYNFYQITDSEAERVRNEHRMFEQQVGKHCNHYPGTYAPFTKVEFTMPINTGAPVLGNLIGIFSEYDILYMFNYQNIVNNKLV